MEDEGWMGLADDIDDEMDDIQGLVQDLQTHVQHEKRRNTRRSPSQFNGNTTAVHISFQAALRLRCLRRVPDVDSRVFGF